MSASGKEASCYSIRQFFFMHTILTVSHQKTVCSCPQKLQRCRLQNRKKGCLCAAAAWYLSKCGCSSWTVISQPSTVSKKKSKKNPIHMGKADTLQTCTRNWLFYLCEVSSANWVTGVSRVTEFGSLVVLLLCSYGPLGSSCFGARLKQKPCVSSRSGTKH